jgi:predicted PurR-regulated permease PerM
MKLWRIAGAVIVLGLALMIIVPVVVAAVRELLVPATVAVVLYVIVRVVNARLNRW